MRLNKHPGVILISVLWVTFILALIAFGLSRRSALEVSVLETYQGKLRSYAAARAGLNYVLDLMDRFPSIKDSLYSVGVAIAGDKKPEDLFAHIDVGSDTYAVVQWNAAGFNGMPAGSWMYGLQDEQGKININAINEYNYQILSALFQIKGLPIQSSDQLAMAIVEFRNGSQSNINGGFQLKDGPQVVLKPKNKPYEHLEELLDVPGMDRGLFDKVKDDLTVYGDAQGGLWVNMRTANDEVLQAVVAAAKRMNPAVETDSVLQRAYNIRNGADGTPFTADDAQPAAASAGTTEDLRNWPPALQEGNSAFIRARIMGVDHASGARTIIDAVIHHAPGLSQNQIVGWQRD